MPSAERGRATGSERGDRSGNGGRGRGGRGGGRSGREGKSGRTAGGRVSSSGGRGVSSRGNSSINLVVSPKPPPPQQPQSWQSQEVAIQKCSYCDMDQRMCLQVGFVLEVCPTCRCVIYCSDACRNKHKIDCEAFLAATLTLNQSLPATANGNATKLKNKKPPKSSNAQHGKAGAFDALLDDDDDEEEGYQEYRGQTQPGKKNPVRSPSSKSSANKSTNKSASDLYAKFGKALAGTTTTTKRPTRSVRPGTLPNPIRSGRTTLGQALDFTQYQKAMNQDMVVYPDPLDSSISTLAGVFEPNPLLGARLGLAVFERCMEKTESLLKLYGSRSPEADYQLRERGIVLQRPSTTTPLFLLHGPHSVGLTQWCLGDTRILVNPNSPATIYCISRPREREMDFWTDEESLFWRPQEVFIPWMMETQLSRHILAVAPALAFRRAMELAEMPTSPPAFKAPDYEYWNRSLVLHALMRKCNIPREAIDPWMGLYEPGTGEIYGGYPVWHLCRKRTTSLVKLTAGKNSTVNELGLVLNAANDHVPKCLYMFRHVLHIATADKFRSNPANGFSLRGVAAPRDENDMLTEPSALFEMGDAAFGEWTFCVDNKWTEVFLAVTPENFFRNSINLADMEETAAAASKNDATKGGRKKKRKKKKSQLEQDDDAVGADAGVEIMETFEEPQNATTTVDEEASHSESQTSPPASTDGVEKDVAEQKMAEIHRLQRRVECAKRHCRWLAIELGLQPVSEDAQDSVGVDLHSADEVIRFLFDTQQAQPPFLLVEESLAISVFEAVMKAENSFILNESKEWLRSCVDKLVVKCIEDERKMAISILSTPGICISANALCESFEKLPKGRSNEYNNNIAKAVSRIKVSFKDEAATLLKTISCRIGKQTRKNFRDVLKKGEEELREIRSKIAQEQTAGLQRVNNISKAGDAPISHSDETSQHGKKALEAERTHAVKNLVPDELNARINVSLQWYWDLLERSRKEGVEQIGVESDSDGDDCNIRTEKDEDLVEESDTVAAASKREMLLSSAEVAEVMRTCADLSEKQQTDVVCSVEKNMDLSSWDNESEWTIDITEQAHKWFRKHVKRQHGLCDRVIRRLKLLAVGRWPYVLCKPLKTKASSVKLYESKIDSGSRIIWEVAVAFSPRRSRAGHSFCEQVIRVWDVVQDHDNLSRSIDRAIDRIVASHLRGRQCMIYSELEDFRETSFLSDRSELQLPRVFSMKQDVAIRNDASLCKTSGDANFRHYPPASDDPCQFTLLKFYELDAGAIKLLLDEKDENCDLPFTPGPKEHEIIHYQTKPERSILLMGRSGTGKTTCLVFRMWAQFMAYAAAEGSRPRQMFVTRNAVLKNEVELSFQNMGLAWRRKMPSSDDVLPAMSLATEAVTFPRFLTASEWLETLDNELPGDHFFTPKEVEERIDCRHADDAVKRGVEALFAEEHLGTNDGAELVRKEMTFTLFKKELWRKLNSRMKSDLDPALAWLEIKSYIKGSVAALHIEDAERSLAHRRFLSRDEYISLPRKMSRIDSAQRHVVYDLYEAYEKIKKERHYFDEMDVVYNLAGRVSLFWNETVAPDTDKDKLLPIDSLYVDEVQDFTQAELYLLVKLSRDPNNLMLAGDTAQSIAVGVGFRFTDVRQIFYESFGGIEPHLLQLTHNYRSHAGILRLAASVVELLYFFFGDSLDRLPPDLGLFTGPKPVMMFSESPEELVLMLDGSKRETSRIEFGAHQVVIVRSDEAKLSLPDEFGVDKDWVMTVQESKGLEFDDVLLYNFFTDSEFEAGDLWRVVSNYTEKDIAEYYNDESVKSSGVQSYDWDKVMETRTRHLEFSNEKHKILETELKMLYTAITRARVNIFIAETDTDLSRPMFEYFKRRQVVDTRTTSGMDGVRVFGVGNSSIEDWRKRGDYYLQNAEGQRQKGCLRLAAKCFDHAGETKKRDYALALHSFIDMEDQDGASKHPRERQGPAMRKRLYGIAAELLEAKDVAFLDKAALCLLRTGDQEYARSAEMFELFARLSYSKRRREGISATSDLASREQQYFAYAAKLFEKCAIHASKRNLAIRAVQNYVCSGTAGFKQAAKLIEEGLVYLQKSFVELASLCRLPAETVDDDPTSPFRRAFPHSKECEDIRKVMNKLAKIACRSCFSRGDPVGVEAALDMISSRPEKIQLLSSLGNDPMRFISQAPWGSHPTYSKLIQDREAKPVLVGRDGYLMDVTIQLIRELSQGNRHGKDDEIVRTLEERGRLLEAAEHLDHLVVGCTTDNSSRHKLNASAADLRARFIRLVLASPRWEQHRSQICSLLEKLTAFLEESNPQAASEAVSITTAYATSRINGTDMWSFLDQCKSSIMWRYESIMMVVASRLGLTGLISQRPGMDNWQGVLYIVETARQMQQAAIALCRSSSSSVRKADEVIIVAQIESYYELKQDQFDTSRRTTAAVTNMKLREAFQDEKDTSLDDTGTAHKLVAELSREKVHAVLARHLYRKASTLLLLIEQHIADQGKKGRPCESIRFGATCKYGQRCKYSHGALPRSAREHIGVLQAQLLCLAAMPALASSANLLFLDAGMGKPLQDRYKTHIDTTASALVAYLIHGNHFTFSIADDALAKVPGGINVVVWRQSTLNVVSVWASLNWRKLSLHQQKTNLIEVIRYWRILRLCDPDKATATVEQALQNMERKNYFVQDIKNGKTDHFLDKTEENPGKVQLLSRMWAWAVDNVEDDLFKSVSLTETLIDRTSRLDGLNTMHKIDQISLLEVNAIAVFSAISLRYSDAPNAKDLYWALPEKIYMNCHLQGEGVNHSRGFGMPIRDVVEKASHKNFFECFTMCVSHLESIAGTMLENELMRSPKKDSAMDAGRFERAIFLGSFVCYNAVLFAVAGIAMSPEEAKDDLNKLPSIPLCGNIKLLVQKLREVVTGSDASERVRKVFAHQKETDKTPVHTVWNDKSTVWDLLQAIDKLLQRSEYSDKLVLCRLRQAGPQHVEVETLVEKSRVASVLRGVQFHEKCNVFSDQYKQNSHKFLLHRKPHEGSTISQDLSAFSRKSDERTALLVIARYVRSWKEKALQEGADFPATTPFQVWKKALGSFVGLVKRWLAEQKQVQSSATPNSPYNQTVQTAHTGVCPLSSIPYLWSDASHQQPRIRQWNLNFMAHSPVFDGIECSFCGIPYNSYIQQERYHWCMGACGNSGSYAVSQFNWQQLGVEQAPFPMGNGDDQYFRQHAVDSNHLTNVQNYENHRETLAQEAAQLDTSFFIARCILDICDPHLIPPEMASWYLNVGEEVRYLLLDLETSHQRLFYEGLPWPNPHLHMLMEIIHASSQKLRDFLVWIQMEERRMTQESLTGDERENEDVGDMGHALDLLNE